MILSTMRTRCTEVDRRFVQCIGQEEILRLRTVQLAMRLRAAKIGGHSEYETIVACRKTCRGSRVHTCTRRRYDSFVSVITAQSAMTLEPRTALSPIIHCNTVYNDSALPRPGNHNRLLHFSSLGTTMGFFEQCSMK